VNSDSPVEMTAVLYDRVGSSEVLRVAQVPRPEPRPGEVRVRVEMSGVNPSDWKSRAVGRYQAPSEANPQIPHHDGAGRIDAVGEGLPVERVGERVWLYFAAWQRRTGTAAQWTVVPSESAVPLPEDVPAEDGASLGIPAITAHRLLGDPQALKGRPVLVRGFGAVGFAALHLAVWAGADVVVTSSQAERRAGALAAGAVAALDPSAPDHLEQLRGALPDGAARIIEVALGRNFADDAELLQSGGVLAVYATDGGPVTDFPFRALLDANAAIEFVMAYRLSAGDLARARDDISAAVADGYLRGRPTKHFDLADTARAHDALEAGEQARIVIDIP
jgi:NADPH2:quinone reductase